MTSNFRTTPANVDIDGLTNLLITSGEQMGPDQYLRELVVNAAQNRGDRVVIDSWQDPDTGHNLMRVSDNAQGMDEKQLRSRISTLLSSSHGYGRNFGWGSRVSTLAFNPAGVDYASRSKEGDNFLRMHIKRGVVGARVWELEGGGAAEVVDPLPGHLDRIDKFGSTGTAVILNGDGKRDTFSPKEGYRVADYLAHKFYEYPKTSTGNPLEVRVVVGGSMKPIRPLAERISATALASGEMPIKTDHYSGRLIWAVIPQISEQKQAVTAALTIPTGVGVLCEGEVFALSKADLAHFGIPYMSVKSQVLLLVETDGAKMNPSRSAVVFRKRGRQAPLTTPPWREIGAYVAANMPDAIQALIDDRAVSAKSIDAKLAAKLDKNWLQRLKKVAVKVSGGSSSGAGDQPGTSPPVDRPGSGAGGSSSGSSRPRASRRNRSGDQAAHEEFRKVLPQVQFVDRAELGEDNSYGIDWNEVMGTILIASDLAPYRRAIANFVRDTGENEAVVAEAVKTAFALELAATVIDARGSADVGLTESEIEDLLEPPALFAKTLGAQSIDSLIRSALASVKADI
ncbi:hypothetical protein N9C30_00980 [bacterium]|nr:hypothetical protein [bacterium]